MDIYEYALAMFIKTNGKEDSARFFEKHLINTDPRKSTRYIGYSIQQYSKRTFKSGERPTKAYEKVISGFHDQIVKSLSHFAKEGITDDELKLGDIPYIYSVIPLSQTSNTPIFQLNYSSGIRGNQVSSVEKYCNYLEVVAKNFMRNVGE